MSEPPTVDTLYVGPARCGRTSILRNFASRSRAVSPYAAGKDPDKVALEITTTLRQTGKRAIHVDDIDLLQRVEQARLASLLPPYSEAPSCPLIATCRDIANVIEPLRERFRTVVLQNTYPLPHVEEIRYDLLGLVRDTNLPALSLNQLHILYRALAQPEECLTPYTAYQFLALAMGRRASREEATHECITLENLLRRHSSEPLERHPP